MAYNEYSHVLISFMNPFIEEIESFHNGLDEASEHQVNNIITQYQLYIKYFSLPPIHCLMRFDNITKINILLYMYERIITIKAILDL